MSISTQLGRNLLVSFFLAVGCGVLWPLALAWISSIWGAIGGQRDVIDESLQVAADGTPVIISQSRLTDLELDRRTIDGEIFPSSYEKWLYPARFEAPDKPVGLVRLPQPWARNRFAGGTDGKRPPNAWYLIRNEGPTGRAYLQAFDAKSKLPAGFIGRDGFRSSRPATDHQFKFPAGNLRGLGGMHTGTQYFRGYNIVSRWDHRLDEQSRIPQWLLYLVESDRLAEIDLRQRTVRTAVAVPSLRAASLIYEVVPPAEDNASATAQGRASVQFASSAQNSITVFEPAITGAFQASDSQPEVKIEARVALRTADQLIIYDPPTGDVRNFDIPEEARDAAILPYLLSSDSVLLQVLRGYWSGGSTSDLLWINRLGEVSRRERIELSGFRPPSDQENAWTFAALMPEPFVNASIIAGAIPIRRLQNGQSTNYRSALEHSLSVTWAPFTLLTALSVILAGVVAVSHRRYYRSHTWAWALFVFLLGLPGLLAYWIHHRRPPLATCDECDRVVPRNRAKCANCGNEFPAPDALGTEIYD